jgi:hypothetical protein
MPTRGLYSGWLSARQGVTIASQNPVAIEIPDDAMRQLQVEQIMKSARFIQPAHRRIFRYAIAAAFLLGLGVLAAFRTPQWPSAHTGNALAAQ